jgi:MFS family permease
MSEDNIGASGPRYAAVFGLLYVPFGIATGYINVTMAYLLAHAGISTAAIGGVVAVAISMQIWKFLWAPLVDVFFSYRRWFLFSTLMMAGAILCGGLIRISQSVVPLMVALVSVMGLFSSLGAISADGLIAHSTSVADKGRAGGWAQAGNLGGAGLGGGAGLWLATHSSPWMAGAILGLICAVCAFSVLLLREPVHSHRQPHYLKTLLALGGEVWVLARSRLGAMAIFLLVIPLGTGATQNLFSSIAGDWRASPGLVALITGALSGLVSIPFSLIGGYIGDLWDRKSAYLLGGGLMAICAIAMAMAGKTPQNFVIFSLLYAATMGIVWGAYGGVVYEAAGGGAAATKCNILSSLCNIPIATMIAVDGWAQTRWGSVGMLVNEACIGAIAIVIFVAVRIATAPRAANAFA